jgi:predicted O-linked N-acetylglucosamine transferase (SPINDLY family)
MKKIFSYFSKINFLTDKKKLHSSEYQRQLGNKFIDQGDLTQAVECYRKAVSLNQYSLESHIGLGFSLKESGELESAKISFQKALEINSESFDSNYFLGKINFELGKFEKSIEYLKKSLQLQPEFESAHGELCQALFQSGKIDEALEIIDYGIKKFPKNSSFYLFKGNIEYSKKEYEKSINSYEKSFQIDSNLIQAQINLTTVFLAQKDFQSAINSSKKALKINPHSPDVYVCIAKTEIEIEKIADALNNCEKALSLEQDNLAALKTKGKILLILGKFQEAKECFEKTLKKEGPSVENHNNLGLIFLKSANYKAAEREFRNALKIDQNNCTSNNNIGHALMEMEQLLESEKYLRRALALDKKSEIVLGNLGGTLLKQNRMPEAISYFKEALLINQKFTTARSNLLYLLSIYSSSSYFDEARKFGEILSENTDEPYTSWQTIRKPVEKLKIGFISGGFYNHPVGFFLDEIISKINREKIQLFAYSTRDRNDDLTQRIRPYFSEWKSFIGIGKNDAAKIIHDDDIHILIDFDGHTSGNLLPVFSKKPAPIQVSWLGFWATTGLKEIDFLLADEITLPLNQRDQFTETIWYLPDTRLCFSPPKFNIPVNSLPAKVNGFITFACFQKLTKVSDAVLSLWGQVLEAVPHSKLRMVMSQLDNSIFRKQLNQRLTTAGIDPARVILAEPMAREDYLASYAKVDIVLDTFPYTGGTTTCEALWMGVPTLTLTGQTMIERQGVGMLSCVGLHDWIASDQSDYVTKAIAHSADFEALAALRKTLREKALASPLFDAPRFARNLENAFLKMWEAKTQELNLSAQPSQDGQNAPSGP